MTHSAKKISILKLIAFTAVPFLIFLILLEIIARILVFFYDDLPMEKKRIICHDMIMHHSWVASRTSIDASREIPYRLVINKQAWPEEYDVSIQKPPNTYRIFYLGDSNTQGVVAPEYKMVKLVEKGLNEKYASSGIKFEVINTGTSSYSFLQYYLMSKKIMEYSPDLVVIDVDMTDVPDHSLYKLTMETDASGDIIAVKPDATSKYLMTPHGFIKYGGGTKLIDKLENYSDLLFFIKKFYTNMTPKQEKAGDFDWLAKNWTPAISKNVDDTLKVLEKNISFLKQNHVKVMITGVPCYFQYTGYFSPKPHEALENLMKKDAVPFLNSYETLKPIIKGSQQTDYYWGKDHMHFNIKGNRIWADAQLNFLCNPANGLLPFAKLDKQK